MQRDKRSAVLISGSGAANFCFAGAQTYSATKAMIANFGQSIHYELKANVDVTVWEMGEVNTTIHLKRQSDSYKSPQAAVSGALTQIGKERFTNGSLSFYLTSLFFPPVWFIAPLMHKAMRKEYPEWVPLMDERDAKAGYVRLEEEEEDKTSI